MTRRRRLEAREIKRILLDNGFALIDQRGSHEKWRSPVTNAVVIVHENRGEPLPLGTLLSIIKGSLLPENVWE